MDAKIHIYLSNHRSIYLYTYQKGASGVLSDAQVLAIVRVLEPGP